MVSEIVETAAILGEINDKTGGNPEYAGKYNEYKKQLTSISSKASKNIARFPVVMTVPNDTASDSFSGSRTNVLLGLTKFIECECARFLITAAGLSPIIDIKTQTIGEKLESLTGYGYTLESVDETTATDINNYNESVEGDGQEEYNSVANDEPLETQGVEAVVKPTMITEDDVPLAEDEYDYDKRYVDQTNYRFGKPEIDFGKSKNEPSVVNIRFTFSNGGAFKDHTIPIIVKASPYFVEPDEMKQFIHEITSGKNFLTTFFRLTSGDMKFWKDFIFDYENMKRYRESRDKLGRWPIAKKLKDDSFYKRILAMFKVTGLMKKFLSGNTSTMPMASIVCSKHELSDAVTRKWRDVLRNPKPIYTLMDKLSILSFSVVDYDAEMTYTYFSGIKEPYVNTFTQLTRQEKADKTIDILQNLVKFMQVQQRRM